MTRASFLFPFFLLTLLGVFLAPPTFAQIPEKLIGDWKGQVSLPHETISLKVRYFQEQGDLFADLFTNSNERYPRTSITLSGNHVILTFPYNGSSIRLLGQLESDGQFNYTAPHRKHVSSPYRYKLTGKVIQLLPDDSLIEGSWMLREDLSCDNDKMSEAFQSAESLLITNEYVEAWKNLYRCEDSPMFDARSKLLEAIVTFVGARADLKAGDYYRAELYFGSSLLQLEKAITQDYGNYKGFTYKGMAYAELATIRQKELETKIQPNSSGAFLITKTEKETPLALMNKSIAEFDRFIFCAPLDVNGYVKRAQAYYKKWNEFEHKDIHLTNALKDYDSAIALDPFSYVLFEERTKIYHALRDKDNATKDLPNKDQ